VRLYGHRGARGERPENTLEGFRYAAWLGLAGIETDIAMTQDGVAVLHHDAELADGRLICQLRYAELPAQIPTLEQALREIAVPEWLLEIKTYPTDRQKSHPPGAMVETVLAVLGQVQVHAAIKAFDWSVLREVALRAPKLTRICLTAPDTEAARDLWWGEGFADMSTAQAVASTGAAIWSCWHGALDGAVIHEAHTLGLKVFAWTVNEPTDFNRLAMDTEGLITDFPSRFLDRSE
jgi:glycerophosphoryl diester phosphodiesterase